MHADVPETRWPHLVGRLVGDKIVCLSVRDISSLCKDRWLKDNLLRTNDAAKKLEEVGLAQHIPALCGVLGICQVCVGGGGAWPHPSPVQGAGHLPGVCVCVWGGGGHIPALCRVLGIRQVCVFVCVGL